MQALEQQLKKHGLEATPSALELLSTCSIEPKDLISGIKREFPKEKQIGIKIAVQVVTLWPQWRGISPAMTKELKAEIQSRTARKKAMKTEIVTKARKISKPKQQFPVKGELKPYLAKTFLELQKLKKGTAKDIAKKTGRKERTEAIYLSILKKKGKLQREKQKEGFIYQIKV